MPSPSATTARLAAIEVPGQPAQSRRAHRSLTGPEHHEVAVDPAPSRHERAESCLDRLQLRIGRDGFVGHGTPKSFSQGHEARVVQAVSGTCRKSDDLGNLIECQTAPEVGHDDLALLQWQDGQRGLGRLRVRLRAAPSRRAGLEPGGDPCRGHGLVPSLLLRLAIPALIAPLRTVRNSQAAGLSGVVDWAASFTNASWTTSSGSSHHCRA